LQRRVDAAPLQIGVRNPLAYDLLKIAYPLGFDPLALGFSFLALHAKRVLFRNVVLLGLTIDRIDDERRLVTVMAIERRSDIYRPRQP